MNFEEIQNTTTLIDGQEIINNNFSETEKRITRGLGNPEGLKLGFKGLIYQDNNNGTAYVKTTGTEEIPINTGWSKIITNDDLSITIGNTFINAASYDSLSAAVSGATSGTILMVDKDYTVNTPIPLKSYLTIKGANNAKLTDGSGNGIFTQSSNISKCNFDNIRFAGSAGKAIYNTGDYYYGDSYIQNCDFNANLIECLYGIFIKCDIRNNTFGVNGTAGTSHRHIYSNGNTCDTNANRVHNNVFTGAKGNYSLYFEDGYLLDLSNNVFENNAETISPIFLNGMYSTNIFGNWFEDNNGIKLVNSGIGSEGWGNYIINFNNNFISSNDNLTHLIYLGSACKLSCFENNGGSVPVGTYTTYGRYAGNNLGDIKKIGYNNITNLILPQARSYYSGYKRENLPLAPIDKPTTPTTTLIESSGNLSVGNYRYRVTYISPAGETTASDQSTIVTTDSTHKQITVTIPIGDGTVTARKIYRTIANGSTAKYLYTISDNTTTTYTDNIADGSLGDNYISSSVQFGDIDAERYNLEIIDTTTKGCKRLLPDADDCLNNEPILIQVGTYGTSNDVIIGLTDTNDKISYGGTTTYTSLTLNAVNQTVRLTALSSNLWLAESLGASGITAT